MDKKTCKKVMDFIDEFPQDRYPEWIEKHLTTCPYCAQYARLSHNLRNLSLRSYSMPEVTANQVSSNNFHPWRWVAGIAASLTIITGLWIGLTISSSEDNPLPIAQQASDILSEDTQVMDDYTEIALLW
ncbi:MAG: anti-sigma factor family protein [Brevinematales bacterium]